MPLASTIRDASSKPPPSLSKSTDPISSAVNAGSAAFGTTPAARGYSNVRSVNTVEQEQLIDMQEGLPQLHHSQMTQVL